MAASGQSTDPPSHSIEKKGKQREGTPPRGVPHGRRPGKKAFMLYLSPELHAAIQMRKAVTGVDMGDIMVGILSEAMTEELAVVRELRRE